MGRNNYAGLKETILGWFKREHPEELWAVEGMPPTLTFRDVEKSMAAGESMGVAAEKSDTVTRELILGRLAELLGKDVGELVDWCNTRFMEKTRAEYKSRQSPYRRKPAPRKIRALAISAQMAVGALAKSLELERIDCLALADKFGKRGLEELRGTFKKMESEIESAIVTVLEARQLVD